MTNDEIRSPKRISRRQAVTQTLGAMTAGAVGMQAQTTNKPDTEITAADIAVSDKVAGRSYTEQERILMARNLGRVRDSLKAFREFELDNRVDPAVLFHPLLPGMTIRKGRSQFKLSSHPRLKNNDSPESIAFASAVELSRLLK